MIGRVVAEPGSASSVGLDLRCAPLGGHARDLRSGHRSGGVTVVAPVPEIVASGRECPYDRDPVRVLRIVRVEVECGQHGSDIHPFDRRPAEAPTPYAILVFRLLRTLAV
jgi:hypothetical protein